MKDESKRKIISEFVGLKSKMYSLISIDDEEVTKAKVQKRLLISWFAFIGLVRAS